MLNVSSDPLLAFDEPFEGSKLSLEILDRLRAKVDFVDTESKGVYYIVPPDMLHHFPEEQITHFHDLGITIVLPDEVQEKGPLLVGAGFPALCLPSILGGWNENDVKLVEPVVDDIYATGPTAMKRGGNNKPWYDLELKRRKAKIAKQSKRRNRK